MKKILYILLLSFLLFSCEKHEEKIEIYLLKNRIRTTEGIPVLEFVKLKNIKYDENLENVKGCNFDSISMKLIYGGKFNVQKENLETKPLIEDEDILKLNIKKSELILSEIGRQKIAKLKPNMKYGIQFAICVNRKPLMTGYFRTIYSSYVYNWNHINYDHYNKEKRIDKDTNFVIRQNKDYEKWKPTLTELEKYPELIKAFKETNRLEN
jgi:hypothetical protein